MEKRNPIKSIINTVLTISLIYCLSVNKLQAQFFKDSVTSLSMISFYAGFQNPAGDLVNRFGYSNNVGGMIDWRTKKNLYITMKGGFIFGKNVKESSILDELKTVDGQIINFGGIYSDVFLYERGFNASLTIGKLIPLSKNNESGIVIKVGPGLLQHKIRIQENDEAAPNLQGEYKKGYDRLTNGISVNEYIGYRYFSQNNRINFFAGIESSQAFTQNRRSFNFDEKRTDKKKRLDILNSLIIGWTFPIFRRETQEFYYD